MKITTGYGKDKTEITIAGAIKLALDANDYAVGQIEAIDGTAGNTARAFGELVELLHGKGLLDDEEVKQFLNYKVDIE